MKAPQPPSFSIQNGYFVPLAGCIKNGQSRAKAVFYTKYPFCMQRIVWRWGAEKCSQGVMGRLRRPHQSRRASVRASFGVRRTPRAAAEPSAPSSLIAHYSVKPQLMRAPKGEAGSASAGAPALLTRFEKLPPHRFNPVCLQDERFYKIPRTLTTSG